jgi:hypothetical protein
MKRRINANPRLGATPEFLIIIMNLIFHRLHSATGTPIRNSTFALFFLYANIVIKQAGIRKASFPSAS